MPFLDVADVSLDPDFADTFSVLRRVETISNKGRAVITPTTLPNIVGTVCWASPNDLRRLPEEQHADKGISIVTPFRLRTASRDGANNWQPDLVFWHGSYFIVVDVQDMTQFGGQVQAIATSSTYVDPPTP